MAEVPALHQWKVHPKAGVVTVLDSDRVHVLTEECWESRPLPDHIETRDVSFLPDGALSCAGRVPSDRIPGATTEAAVRVQEAPDTPWQARSPRLGPLDAIQTIRSGGLAELRKLDAEGSPILASCLCSWFTEDESSFLFALRSGGKDTVKRLKSDTVRLFDRSGAAGPRAAAERRSSGKMPLSTDGIG